MARETYESDYATRNGTAEAIADHSQGKPAKLFWYQFNGRSACSVAPGFSPEEIMGQAASEIWVHLWDADFREGARLHPSYRDAQRFAREYNRAMFELRAVEIGKALPNLRLAE